MKALEKILSTGALVFAVVILHNLCGYGCGYVLGSILKPPIAKKESPLR